MKNTEKTGLPISELLAKITSGLMTFKFNKHIFDNNLSMEDHARLVGTGVCTSIKHTVNIKQYNLDKKRKDIKKHQDEYLDLYKKELEKEQYEINLWIDTCHIQFGDPVSSCLSEGEDSLCSFTCKKCKETMDWILIDENTLGLSVPPSQKLKGIADSTCKFEISIPLEINNPYCPKEIVHNNVADSIRKTYRDSKVMPDPQLRQFLDEYPEGKGYEWQKMAYSELIDKSAELIITWINYEIPDDLLRERIKQLFEKVQK